MTTPAAGGRRRLRLVNRTDRPWVLVVLDGGETAGPLGVVGSLLALPYGESGVLDLAAWPERPLHAALINHVHYESVVVSAVVTRPRPLPDRAELVLEAVADDGGLRLVVAAEERSIAPPSGAAPASDGLD